MLRRHQTLRATLEWSHALLTPDEQTVFRRLGRVRRRLHARGRPARGAATTRIDPWTALDHLGALVDKSLVLAEGDPVPRYRLLETTRAYALERLAEAGETQAMLRRHAEALLATLQPLRVGRLALAGDGRRRRLAAAELDNLRAALTWADTAPEGRDIVVPLAAASFCVWWSAPRFAEGLARCLALAQARRRHASQARRRHASG